MSTLQTKAIRIDEVGPPEVMKYVDVTLGEPGPGEVLVNQKACGLNYIDVYFRSGYYPHGACYTGRARKNQQSAQDELLMTS